MSFYIFINIFIFYYFSKSLERYIDDRIANEVQKELN